MQVFKRNAHKVKHVSIQTKCMPSQALRQYQKKCMPIQTIRNIINLQDFFLMKAVKPILLEFYSSQRFF